MKDAKLQWAIGYVTLSSIFVLYKSKLSKSTFNLFK